MTCVCVCVCYSPRDEPQCSCYLSAGCTQCTTHKPPGALPAGSAQKAHADDQVRAPLNPYRSGEYISDITGIIKVCFFRLVRFSGALADSIKYDQMLHSFLTVLYTK